MCLNITTIIMRHYLLLVFACLFTSFSQAQQLQTLNSFDSADWYIKKGFKCITEGKYLEAEQLYIHAITLCKKSRGAHMAHQMKAQTVLFNLKTVTNPSNDSEAVFPIWENMVSNLPESPQKNFYWHQYYDAYTSFLAKNNLLDRALQYNTAAEKYLYKAEIPDDYDQPYNIMFLKLMTQFNRSSLYIKKKELQTAKKLLIEIERLAQDSLNGWFQKTAFVGIWGDYYASTGHFEKAIEAYHNTLQYMQTLSELGFPTHSLESKAVIFDNIGRLYKYFGNFSQSLNYHKKALVIRSQSDVNNFAFKRSLSKSYNNLGELSKQSGAYKQALNYYQQALQMAEQINDPISFSIGSISNNIGETHFALGNYREALKWHRKALKVRQQIPFHPYLTNSYDYVGACLTKLGDLDEAIGYLNQALALRKSNIDAQYHANYFIKSYLNLSEYYEQKKDILTAIDYAKKAVKVNKIQYQGDRLASYYAWNKVGKLYMLMNDPQKALAAYDTAISINHVSFFTDQENIDLDACFDKNALFQSLVGKGNVAFKQQQTQTAMNTFLLADQVLIKIRQSYQTQKDKLYLSSIARQFYDLAISTAWQIYEQEKNQWNLHQMLELSEHSRAGTLIDAQVANQALKFSNLPDSVVEEDNQLKILINYHQQKLLADNTTENRQALFQTKLAHQDFLELLEKTYPAYYQYKYHLQNFDLVKIQKSLLHEQQILEYYVADDFIFAFLISKNDFKVFKIKNQHLNTSTILSYRSSIIQDDITSFKQMSHLLYRQLIEPVVNHLDQKQLVIIADGLLWYINFDLLLTKPIIETDYRELPYLLKEYAINYAYTIQLARKSSTSSNQANLLAFAPSYEKLNRNQSRKVSTCCRKLGMESVRS